jgi:hypothetical protein
MLFHRGISTLDCREQRVQVARSLAGLTRPTPATEACDKNGKQLRQERRGLPAQKGIGSSVLPSEGFPLPTSDQMHLAPSDTLDRLAHRCGRPQVGCDRSCMRSVSRQYPTRRRTARLRNACHPGPPKRGGPATDRAPRRSQWKILATSKRTSNRRRSSDSPDRSIGLWLSPIIALWDIRRFA